MAHGFTWNIPGYLALYIYRALPEPTNKVDRFHHDELMTQIELFYLANPYRRVDGTTIIPGDRALRPYAPPKEGLG